MHAFNLLAFSSNPLIWLLARMATGLNFLAFLLTDDNHVLGDAFPCHVYRAHDLIGLTIN